MPSFHEKKGWEISENEVTPESAFIRRRKFIKGAGLIGGAALGGAALQQMLAPPPALADAAGLPPLKAPRNKKFTVQRDLTEEEIAASYNNFYEFSEQKLLVRRLVKNFKNRPWQVQVDGLVRKPRTFNIEDILKEFGQEERIYRFRCVEAWAMTVPWIGFPFRELIKKVDPKPEARYIRMLTFFNPKVAPNQRTRKYPWPYYEGLRIDEANNDLTLLATGIYGHELPGQHGSPIRLIVPWKYGFKSIKSIVRIEFTDKPPHTFWNDLAPGEYDFMANVNPKVPHPRWSQAYERIIGTRDRLPTRLYNGYAPFVADLY